MRTITFHRNLNATNGRAWTYKPNGYAVQATTLVAHNVTIKQPSGKSFEQCLDGGNRSVFAWFKTKSIVANCPIELPHNAKRIRFNPKRGDKCFAIEMVSEHFPDVVSLKRIDQLQTVYCLPNGIAYGIEH